MNRISDFLLIIFLWLTVLAAAGCGSSSGGDGTSEQLKYAALGASDATGIGATPLSNGYVYQIEEGIEDLGREVELENLGIPGAKIGTILDVELPLLSRFEPELVTIFTGANDLIAGDDPGKFESDLNELLSRTRENSAPQVLIAIATLPDLTQAPRFIDNPDPDVTSSRIAAFNNAISSQALGHQALLVDLFSLPVNDEVTSDADGFHPNDEGHRLLAEAFLAVLAPRIQR